MKKCTKCGSKDIIAIEYGYSEPEHYDGISEYRCLDCFYREGRWTKTELKENEIESRYGTNDHLLLKNKIHE